MRKLVLALFVASQVSGCVTSKTTYESEQSDYWGDNEVEYVDYYKETTEEPTNTTNLAIIGAIVVGTFVALGMMAGAYEE